MGQLYYYIFGWEIVSLRYNNILKSSIFGYPAIIFGNILVILFISLNNILNYKPAKEFFTLIMRERYWDSIFWTYLSISLI